MGARSELWFFLSVSLLYFSLETYISIGADTISAGQSLTGNQTIISQGGNFELGFFKPGKALNYYIGIWYKRVRVQTIVWVANRDKPLSEPSLSELKISEDGNLVLLDKSNSLIWSSNSKSKTLNSTVAVLLDSGNLVLKYGSTSSVVLWQSLDHPTDTWLPGGRLGVNKVTGETRILTSWRGSVDPSPGIFTLEMDPNRTGQYFVQWNGSQRYWSTVVSGVHIFNYFFNYSYISNERENYISYSVSNSSIFTRFVLDFSGQIKQLTLLGDSQQWTTFWFLPKQPCEVSGYCGAFGICKRNEIPVCECLQGFLSRFPRDFSPRNFSSGCVRKTPLQCWNSSSINGEKDGFLALPDMRLPDNPQSLEVGSAEECKLTCLNNCSCNSYAYKSGGCSIWGGDLLNLQQLSNDDSGGNVLFLRLAASELTSPPSPYKKKKSQGNKRQLWLIAAVPVALTILISGFFLFHLWRGKLKQKGEKETSQDLLIFDLGISIKATNDELTNVNKLGKAEKKDVELPLFSFASVSAATDNFSAANMLGEGGFGLVYKGKLLKGQEVAVKRLSRRSGQGLEELKNETILMTKLQHRNLVRILGCCIEGEEKILIYEYMPNKSLDSFLFDPSKRELLDWGKRIHIIEGIAQGLLYLHQYSRLRIIHRDLKASNILLDIDMNPKISDFGMARIFGGNESHANTNRVVGTYGYMAPEYAMEGLFSIKSDVFSFGVLLLEIVSGKTNTGFDVSESLDLLGYAWELWESDRWSEMIDPMLGDPSSTTIPLRFIHISLLCVQENALDRPTMYDVVSMLSNELGTLPSPKQPAFFNGRSGMEANSHTNRSGICSVSDITVSTMEAQ